MKAVNLKEVNHRDKQKRQFVVSIGNWTPIITAITAVGALIFAAFMAYNGMISRFYAQFQVIQNEISTLRKESREDYQDLQKVVAENSVKLGILTERTASIIRDIEIIKSTLGK